MKQTKIYVLEVWEHRRNGGKSLMHKTLSTNFKDIQKRILKKETPENKQRTTYEIKIKIINGTN